MQIRNGVEFFPSEPIIGSLAPDGIKQFKHVQMLIETYKGWNKMHDPSMDGAIDPISYGMDCIRLGDGRLSAAQRTSLHATARDIMTAQLAVGRCQFAISLEGDELGKDKSTITGRKGMIPFDILLTGNKIQDGTSYTLPFIRADFVVYIRPDLVVTVLGR